MLLDTIKKATVNYQAIVRVVDSTDGTPETSVVYNTAGVDLWYRREGGSRVAITEATQTVGGAHSDGGFVHVSDGYCRLDLPDAAVATGVDFVDIGGVFTGMVVIGGRIRLTDFDFDDAVRGGLTALPNAVADAAGGLAISDAGGLDLDAILADTNELQGDWVDGGRLDLILDIIAADTTTDIPALIATAQADLDIITGADGVNLLSATQASIDAIEVDTSTTLDTHLTDMKGATFSGATDSLEAIRNRGDSAWTGAPPTVTTGTAQAGAANSITLAAGASATDDLYNLLRVSILTGTGAGQTRAISDYNGTTKVATVINAWAVNPDATSTYEVVSDAITEITAAPTAAAIADAVWDENTSGHTTASTFGEQCKNDIDAILTDTGSTLDGLLVSMDANITSTLVDTNELQTDWANGGRLDLLIDAILADTGELQTDWVNGGRLDLIADAILADTAVIGAAGAGLTALASAANLATADTVVDAIKVVTDQMVFTKANELDVNALSMNGAAIVGDGNATPWDGA